MSSILPSRARNGIMRRKIYDMSSLDLSHTVAPRFTGPASHIIPPIMSSLSVPINELSFIWLNSRSFAFALACSPVCSEKTSWNRLRRILYTRIFFFTQIPIYRARWKKNSVPCLCDCRDFVQENRLAEMDDRFQEFINSLNEDLANSLWFFRSRVDDLVMHQVARAEDLGNAGFFTSAVRRNFIRH